MATVTLAAGCRSVKAAGRRSVEAARVEKELFPAAAGRPAVTKEDLAAYTRDIAPCALPHL